MISQADTVILIGAVLAAVGLIEPRRLLGRLSVDYTTLVVVGVILGTIGLFLKAVLE